MTKNLKMHLLTYFVVIAFAIANPDFARPEDTRSKSGFYFFLEGRMAVSNGDATTFAEGVSEGLISGELFNVDTEFGGGGRAGGGYQFGKLDVGLMYSGLRLTGNRDPLNSIGLLTTMSRSRYVGIVYPVLGTEYYMYMRIFSGFYFTKAEAEASYHVVDFEAGYNLQLGKTDVRLFAGLRYANFDQTVNTAFFIYCAYCDGVRDGFYFYLTEKRDVDFWGIGPRLGASVHRAHEKGPFGLMASASGALLFGNKETLTTQFGVGNSFSFGPFPDNRTISRRDLTVWNMEGEVGVTYQTAVGKAMTMMFTLGYRAEAWYDVNDTSSLPLTFSGTLHGSTEAEQFFHGPFLRGEFRF